MTDAKQISPAVAGAQWMKERAALIQCARALAWNYAGTIRPNKKREKQALWDAMHAAYDALGVLDTHELTDRSQDRIQSYVEWGIRERGGVVACASEEHAYSIATCNDDRSVRQRTVTICVDGSEYRSPWSLPNPVVIEH